VRLLAVQCPTNIDHLCGSAAKSKNAFPEKEGVVGDYMPDGFIQQQRFRLRRQQS
jgi:sterol desaturase/sphingolipid hydroxylase (fatty acid hydroxylase superfamily)